MRIILGLLIVAALSVSVAQAELYTFTPKSGTLGSLAHDYWYKWGIRWELPAGEKIVSAKLVYSNIYDWVVNGNDHLYTHLLDEVLDTNGSSTPNYVSLGAGDGAYKSIVVRGYDNAGGGDKFASAGPLIGHYQDPDGPQTREDVVCQISSTYFSMLGDGAFGFGIDPDCHYYHCGVRAEIVTQVTQPIPAPPAVLLGMLGLVSAGAWRKFSTRRAVRPAAWFV